MELFNSQNPIADQPKPKQRRRRARMACVECHKRKVRCDRVFVGKTCTNCKLDRKDCIALRIPEVRPYGGSSLDENTLETRTSVTERGEATQIARNSEDVTSISTSRSLQNTSNSISFTGLYKIGDTDNRESRPMWSMPNLQGLSTSPFSFRTPKWKESNMDVLYMYYNFLDCEPLSHILPEDMEFLEFKGCMRLPRRPILDEFIRAYFLFIHPTLPLLDEGQFWDMYLDKRPSRRTNCLQLFVFRAMIFASCSFVSLSTVQALGYESNYEARISLYNRAKLLYDFNAISDPIGISQGALLLTYFSSKTQQHANTSWLRIAIQFANASNAHLYYETSKFTEEQQRIRKRLWWCCILRDRILPLGVRRSLQITREHFDFCQPMLSEQDLESKFHYFYVYNNETKRRLAKHIVSLLQLAIHLTDVISLVYPVNKFSIRDPLDDVTFIGTPDQLKVCKENLKDWLQQTQRTICNLSEKSVHTSVVLFNNLMMIYYYSATAALCHHEAYVIEARSSSDNIIHQPSLQSIGTTLHTAIAGISKSIDMLVKLDIARYLPVSMIAYMALPLLLSVYDVQMSATRGQDGPSQSRRHSYKEAYDLCQTRYTGADQATLYIDKTVATATTMSKQITFQTPGTVTGTLQPQEQVESWFEAFLRLPKLYLRISLTIDMSFSLGRYPDEQELPKHLIGHVEPETASPSNSETPYDPISVDDDLLLSQASQNISDMDVNLNDVFHDIATTIHNGASPGQELHSRAMEGLDRREREQEPLWMNCMLLETLDDMLGSGNVGG